MRTTNVFLPIAALAFLGSARAPAPPEPQRFTFRAEAVERARDRVVCLVRIENTGSEESELRIYGRWHGQRGSVMVDDLGNEYPTRVGTAKGLALATYIQRFVPGVPLTVRFVADSVSADARRVTLVIRAVGIGEPVVLSAIPIAG